MTTNGFIPRVSAAEEAIAATAGAIRPLDPAFYQEARAWNDSLCKPLGSLGSLEEIRERLWAIRQGRQSGSFKKAVIVYAGDNGVCSEGISANPQSITYKVCLNILSGRSGLGRIAAFYGVDVALEDLAVLQDVEGATDFKLRKGTHNMAKGPALSREEAAGFVLAGIRRTRQLISSGYDLIGAGEMGVGNTTTSAAVISLLLGLDPGHTTGFGSGQTRSGLAHKVQVVEQAIASNAPYGDVLDILAKLSGADICAMAGTYLACAAEGIPFVLDGVISMAAFAAAWEFSPLVREYAFPSHRSEENGARAVAERFALKPMLDLGMRLGEGSGCPLAMNLMECAVFALDSMASFHDVAVNKEDYIDIREELK